jgi:hypothetical protein
VSIGLSGNSDITQIDNHNNQTVAGILLATVSKANVSENKIDTLAPSGPNLGTLSAIEVHSLEIRVAANRITNIGGFSGVSGIYAASTTGPVDIVHNEVRLWEGLGGNAFTPLFLSVGGVGSVQSNFLESYRNMSGYPVNISTDECTFSNNHCLLGLVDGILPVVRIVSPMIIAMGNRVELPAKGPVAPPAIRLEGSSALVVIGNVTSTAIDTTTGSTTGVQLNIIG